jgi:hypothetical protein
VHAQSRTVSCSFNNRCEPRDTFVSPTGVILSTDSLYFISS